MNKLSSILIIALLLATTACDKTKETPNGFKYKVEKAGNGITPKVGEILVFDYVMKDSKDSVWGDTHENGMPAAVMINDSAAMKGENGMVQMFRQLSVGDSVIVEMPVKKFFKDIVGGPLPKEIDSTVSIKYLIKVTEITDREKFQVKQRELMDKKMAEQLGKDTVAIDKFLAEKGITAQKTESGLRYVITQPGKGPNATSGQLVQVNYTGYLLDGKYFDTSVKSIAQEKGLYNARREPYKPFDLTIDRSGVIKGWHEALKLMNKGAKGTFYIPSPLGYGPQQMSDVLKPNSILVFDIEMLDIKDQPAPNGQPAQK
jgi:FKBP-type peptidyl-prolyl cis-trans isomerase FkpA